MTPRTIGVLLIWYITHIQGLDVLCRRVFQLSQHKESVDSQTDLRWPIFELDQDLTQTNILTKSESSLYKSIPVIAAQRKCRRTLRPQMTFIRTWPRSYPNKHSDQVWKFSVEKYSSYRSTKKVWTDRQAMWSLFDFYRFVPYLKYDRPPCQQTGPIQTPSVLMTPGALIWNMVTGRE